MAKPFQLIVLILNSLCVLGQPLNDECFQSIDLGHTPVCEPVVYSNIGATPSLIGHDNTPSCFQGENASQDVWFRFKTSPLQSNYTISVIGSGTQPLRNMQVALYRGLCGQNTLGETLCAVAQQGDIALDIQATNLSPGESYFLRIDNFSGLSSQGEFTICIEEEKPEFLISSGSSNACTGILYDSGGPHGNYSNDEDHVFTICPQEVFQCINLDFTYYHMEKAGPLTDGDLLHVYNGPDTLSPLLLTLGEQTNAAGNTGSGGVCLGIQGDQCLTLHFISDNSLNFEGFEAIWECSSAPCRASVFEITDNNVTDEDIEALLSTPLTRIKVKNVDCTFDRRAMGLFETESDGELGMQKGLLMTTGSPLNAIGPNTVDDAGTDNFNSGDEDLNILSQLYGSGVESFDACVIEMDVIPQTASLSFEYIFGSEEYPEFAHDDFNDIFALLISGPGINDGIPEIGGQKNLAVLHGTGEFVEINNVNDVNNWEYYRDNSEGQALEYDGLTSDFKGIKKSLTAKAMVNPCDTYNLKFAIADRLDFEYDSGVFISEITAPVPEVAFYSDLDLGYLTESCHPGMDSIRLTFPQPLPDSLVIAIVFSGEATKDLDYLTDLPDTLIVHPDMQEIIFAFNPVNDTLAEGTELVRIELVADFGCGDVVLSSFETTIQDQIQVEFNADTDSITVCAYDILELNVIGGNSYFWSPTQLFEDPFADEQVIYPDSSGWIRVLGGINGFQAPGCISEDSLFIQLIKPQVEIQTNAGDSICLGDTMTLFGTATSDMTSMTWIPVLGLHSPDMDTTTVNPPVGNKTYSFILQGILDGCIDYDTLMVFVDEFVIPSNIVSDTVLCSGSSIQLADPVFPGPTIYQWTPEEFLNSDSIAHPIARPDSSVDYSLLVQSPSGLCAEIFNVSIDIIQNELLVSLEDTIRICRGDIVEAEASSVPSDDGITWITSSPFLDSTNTQIVLAPQINDLLIVSHSNGSCTISDTTVIIVDSMPVPNITVIPDFEKYCIGEEIVLLSEAIDFDKFPFISFRWVETAGIIDYEANASNASIIIEATDTLTYTRIAENGVCRDTQNITINVPKVEVGLSVNDTILCAGDELQLILETDVAVDEIQWIPDLGLSCHDCPDPILTGIVSQLYTVQVEVDECSFRSMFYVEVIDPTDFEIGHSHAIAPVGTEVRYRFESNSGISPDGYQWYVDGDLVPGTDTSEFPWIVTSCVEEIGLEVRYGSCVAFKTIELKGGINLELNVTDTAVCPGSTIGLSAMSLVDPDNISWTPTQGLSCVDCSDPSLTVENGGRYYVTVHWEECEYTASLNVSLLDPPSVTIIDSHASVPIGDSVFYTFETQPLLTPTFVQWYINDTPVSGANSEVLKTRAFYEDQEIAVEVLFGDACPVRDSISLEGRLPEWPNVFVPNSDNDLNQVFTLGWERAQFNVERFEIFNRWGKRIFDCDESSCLNAGWDGLIDGRKAPEDVYFYIVQFNVDGEVSYRQNGQFTLFYK